MSIAPSIDLSTGAGSFVFKNQSDGDHNPLTVHYYWPVDADENTRVIFVMHGLLRDGESYRNRWQPHAEQHQFLLVVPEFDREFYPADVDYNLAGMVDSENSDEFNAEEDWAFHCIESLFEMIRQTTPFTAKHFGIYGHSAGAQFVHRLVLFHPECCFDVAVAANAGWYTFPCQETEFPYGVAGAPLNDSKLATALQKKMIILLGEEDIDKSHHSLRRTAKAMQQGSHRLERGRNFIDNAAKVANRLDVSCHWSVETVPNAAHNDRQMSKSAIQYLV